MTLRASPTTARQFAQEGKVAGTAASALWLGTFVLLLGFILVARWSFVKFLRDVVEPRLLMSELGAIQRKARSRRREDGEFGAEWNNREKAEVVVNDEEVASPSGSSSGSSVSGASLRELEAGLNVAVWMLTCGAGGTVGFLVFQGTIALLQLFRGQEVWFAFVNVFFDLA
ncbi:hypothetical protein HK101_009197, partial [Irineochytrium annulatum]